MCVCERDGGQEHGVPATVESLKAATAIMRAANGVAGAAGASGSVAAQPATAAAEAAEITARPE